MDQLCLVMPLPVSVNNLYRNKPGVGRIRTRAYKRWIDEADLALRMQPRTSFKGDVVLDLAFGPRKKGADCSNLVKAVEDRLVAWGIIEDDAFVVKVTARWSSEVRGCMALIELAAIPDQCRCDHKGL